MVHANVMDACNALLPGARVLWECDSLAVTLTPSENTQSCQVTPQPGAIGVANVKAITHNSAGQAIQQTVTFNVTEPQPVTIELTIG